MNCYARFKEDLIFEGEILYKKNNNGKKTRYAVVDEDEKSYYIAHTPNDTDCNKVIRFSKDCEGTTFELVEE